MCNNKELNKDYLDAYIVVLIGDRLKPKNLRKAVSKVNQLAYEDVAYLYTQWRELKRNTEEFRTFIQQFVKAIHVRPYDFDIVLDVGFGVVELTETIPTSEQPQFEMTYIYVQFEPGRL